MLFGYLNIAIWFLFLVHNGFQFSEDGTFITNHQTKHECSNLPEQIGKANMAKITKSQFLCQSCNIHLCEIRDAEICL